jgi:hypothetical protein
MVAEYQIKRMKTSMHKPKFNIDNSIAYVSLTAYLLSDLTFERRYFHSLNGIKNQIFKITDQHGPDLMHNLE